MRVVLKNGKGVELVAGELLADNPLALQQAIHRGDITFSVVHEESRTRRVKQQPASAGAATEASGG